VGQAHHLQEGQEGRQEVVLYSQNCSHPSIKQDYRREKFKQDDRREHQHEMIGRSSGERITEARIGDSSDKECYYHGKQGHIKANCG